MDIETLLKEIRNAAYEVRKHFAPGYLESVYQKALLIELRLQGLKAEEECPLPVRYKGFLIGDFKADIIVNDSVILELKAINEILPMHEVQLVNYLNVTGIDHGYLINYGADKFRIIHKTRIYTPHQSFHTID